ncbi:MAG: hypothetical protein Kow0077_23570 [Anaerolineae bacterium]
MIEIVWEAIVRPEGRGQFELVFGPGGAWSNLFGKCPGFRGTTVLNDTDNPGRYLIIELWETEEQQSQAWDTYPAEYAKLESDLAHWTESRNPVGVFRVRAEATVRPRGKPARRKR